MMKPQLAVLLLLACVTGIGSAMYSSQSCSRMCPCYYQSLFCKGYGYSYLPADLTRDVINIDFQDNRLTELNSDTFRNLTNLKKLLLGGNQIAELEKTSFLSLGHLEALDLSDNMLTEITGSVFEPIRQSIQHLTIEGNSISHIEGLFRYMRGLQTLNIRRNHVTMLTVETLYQNKRLRFLQLSDNNISYIASNAFKRQAELEYLYLDNNRLVNVTELRLPSKSLIVFSAANASLPQIPRGLPKSIKQLNLAGNRIESIGRNELSQLTSLSTLDLSRNRISSIDHKSFRNLVTLTTMYLSRNRIQELPRRLGPALVHLTLDHNIVSFLPRDAFGKSPQLRAVALDHNMIEFIHKKAFVNLTMLEDLQLNHNVITRLPSFVFKDLVKLKSLDLSSNPGLAFEAGSLDGLCELSSLTMNELGSQTHTKGYLLADSSKLRVLNLHNSEGVAKSILKYDLPMYFIRSVQYLNLMKNNLQTLPQTFPQYLPDLIRVHLTDNPWSCTRELYWLQTWLVSGKVQEPHINHIYCETPQHLRDRRLASLNVYDWVLSYTTSSTSWDHYGP